MYIYERMDPLVMRSNTNGHPPDMLVIELFAPCLRYLLDILFAIWEPPVLTIAKYDSDWDSVKKLREPVRLRCAINVVVPEERKLANKTGHMFSSEVKPASLPVEYKK